MTTMPSLWSAPNLLSFSRIVAAPVLYAFVVSGWRFGFVAAAVVFVLASLTDTLDGEIARRRHLVSPFGIYLDTTSDKIMVAVLLVCSSAARRHRKGRFAGQTKTPHPLRDERLPATSRGATPLRRFTCFQVNTSRSIRYGRSSFCKNA